MTTLGTNARQAEWLERIDELIALGFDSFDSLDEGARRDLAGLYLQDCGQWLGDAVPPGDDWLIAAAIRKSEPGRLLDPSMVLLGEMLRDRGVAYAKRTLEGVFQAALDDRDEAEVEREFGPLGYRRLYEPDA